MHHTRLRSLVAALSFAAIASLNTQPALASAETAAVGGSVTFAVTVDGTSPFTFQWYKDGAAISGATAATYSIDGVQRSDAGTYRVTVTNAVGSTTSDDATLAVVELPAFVTQPEGRTVAAGVSVTLAAAAAGFPAPTYQWCKDGVNIAGATGASYTIAGVAPGDAGTYTVVASNAGGSATSDAAILIVGVAPVYTVQPAGRMAAAGAAVTFTAAANGVPTPTYQWRKDGADIPGATGATYTIASVTYADAGAYSVVAVNVAGSATSGDAVLAVGVAPVITTQPVSKTTTAGLSVTFTAAATGSPAPTYQWRKDGVAISGATGSSYRIATVQRADAGIYTVVAANSAGSAASSGAVLTVNIAPSITSQPASQTVKAGATVTFTVTAYGTPAPTYQWRRDGGAISGATGASYVINGVTADAAGTYTVVVANAAGSVTSVGAVLTVNVPPVFTLQPASRTAVAGASVTFTAAASGTPAPTYQWCRNGAAISGATGAAHTIARADPDAAGTYTVVAANAAGSATSAAATLTVAASPPSFTRQPVSWTVKIGAAVTFVAAADGAPAPAYQWRKDGNVIGGATEASLTITDVSLADAGTYSVVATNGAGSVTSTAAMLRTVNAASLVPADFNFDGHSDLVCQNRTTGERAIWLMNGTKQAGRVSLGVVACDWSIAGVGDYNDDGNPDLFWQNAATGECAVWLMNGTALSSVDSLGVVSADWQMAAIGDFDGNGCADIIWQNRATGERFFWLTDGGAAPEVVFLRTLGTDNSIVGSGDFDGDGEPDILLENTTTGDRTIWLMQGVTPIGSVAMGRTSTAWQIVGTGDFNGDGDPDVILENAGTGNATLWLMRGTRRPGNSVYSLGLVGPDWWIRN